MKSHRARILLLLAVLLLLGAVGGASVLLGSTVFARAATPHALSATTFSACEVVTGSPGSTSSPGQIDPDSITQDDGLTCPVPGGNLDATQLVTWSVTGPQGTQGIQGDPGPQGVQGVQGIQGDPGLPFSQAACTETGLSGPSAQENALFCVSGIEPDGGLVYTAAIKMAGATRLIVGTPISEMPSVDWGGTAITYVEFTSGYHAEYHSDHVVRFYNTLSHQVF